MGKPFDTKNITRLVFSANLLADVLTNKTKQHRKIHNLLHNYYNSINLNTIDTTN